MRCNNCKERKDEWEGYGWITYPKPGKSKSGNGSGWPQPNAAPALPPLTASGLRARNEDGSPVGGVHRLASSSTRPTSANARTAESTACPPPPGAPPTPTGGKRRGCPMVLYARSPSVVYIACTLKDLDLG